MKQLKNQIKNIKTINDLEELTFNLDYLQIANSELDNLLMNAKDNVNMIETFKNEALFLIEFIEDEKKGFYASSDYFLR